ncbi:LIM domain-containing protein [Salix suchowensis]|nr:LIM domain-containing protein [Salix suchowensis]
MTVQVLERVHTIMRLVDELALLYKEAALRIAREQIRSSVLEILILLQQCKGLQFKASWDKHSNDVNLTGLCLSLSVNTTNTVDAQADQFHGDSLQRSSQPLKPQ